MSDMLDQDLAAFDQMLGIEPEAAPEGTPEPVAEVPEPEAPEDGRPRDEQGRFTKAEEQTSVEEQAEQLLAGKFKSPEELEHAYTELQSRMGQQGSELGQLRETLEKLNQRLEVPEQEPQFALDQPTIDWFDEQVERSPQAAATWAKENDTSGVLYQRALDYWKEDDPFAAATWVFNDRLEQQKKEFAEQLTQHTRPLVEQSRQQAIASAWNAAKHQLPDLDERAAEVLKAAEFAPELARGLMDSDDQQERVNAVVKLYYLAGGMAGFQNQSAPSTEAAAALQAAARDAKLSGTVASQTQSADPQPVDEGSQWLQDIGFDAVLDRYSPVED